MINSTEIEAQPPCCISQTWLWIRNQRPQWLKKNASNCVSQKGLNIFFYSTERLKNRHTVNEESHTEERGHCARIQRATGDERSGVVLVARAPHEVFGPPRASFSRGREARIVVFALETSENYRIAWADRDSGIQFLRNNLFLFLFFAFPPSSWGSFIRASASDRRECSMHPGSFDGFLILCHYLQ